MGDRAIAYSVQHRGFTSGENPVYMRKFNGTITELTSLIMGDGGNAHMDWDSIHQKGRNEYPNQHSGAIILFEEEIKKIIITIQEFYKISPMRSLIYALTVRIKTMPILISRRGLYKGVIHITPPESRSEERKRLLPKIKEKFPDIYNGNFYAIVLYPEILETIIKDLPRLGCELDDIGESNERFLIQ